MDAEKRAKVSRSIIRACGQKRLPKQIIFGFNAHLKLRVSHAKTHPCARFSGNKRVAWPPTQEQTVFASAIEQQIVFPNRQVTKFHILTITIF
jgi:hypothetical protein